MLTDNENVPPPLDLFLAYDAASVSVAQDILGKAVVQGVQNKVSICGHKTIKLPPFQQQSGNLAGTDNSCIRKQLLHGKLLETQWLQGRSNCKMNRGKLKATFLLILVNASKWT